MQTFVGFHSALLSFYTGKLQSNTSHYSVAGLFSAVQWAHRHRKITLRFQGQPIKLRKKRKTVEILPLAGLQREAHCPHFRPHHSPPQGGQRHFDCYASKTIYQTFLLLE